MLKAAIVAVLLAVPMPAQAEVWASDANNVTSASSTVTFARASSCVALTNTGAVKAYFRLFKSTETAAAATTAHIPLSAGQAKTYCYDSSTEGGDASGYGSATLITASSTTTVDIEGK